MVVGTRTQARVCKLDLMVLRYLSEDDTLAISSNTTQQVRAVRSLRATLRTRKLRVLRRVDHSPSRHSSAEFRRINRTLKNVLLVQLEL